jgi:N-acetylglutamate synthase-like GNAT family acetyltransferase
VYVAPTWRGRGVGAALVARLLEQHRRRGRSVADTYLLTLEPTCGWYERLGFSRVDEERAPRQMALELAAGKALSALLGNQLACMRGRQQ